VPLKVGDVIGNPRLAAQYVHTVEAELSYRPPRAFSVRTDLAYNLLLNGAQFTLQETNQIARNIARVNSLSWETEVSAHWRDWVKGYGTFELNYALREIGDVGYLQQLVGTGNIVYPTVIVHAGAMGRIPIPKFQLRLTAELSWIGTRRASDQNTLAAGAPYELPSYVTFDATLSTLGLQLLEGRETTIRVIGRNLTGTAGPDPGFSGFDYPVAPRMVIIQLTQQL